VYANPYHTIQAVGNSDPSALISLVEEEITAGGFGFGFSEGIGYVGRGVGIAALSNVDSWLWRLSTLGATAELGDLRLGVGADLSIFELNAAIFTRATGKHFGGRPTAGMSVEATIRF
jgi:hypothetical protein